MSSAIVLGHLFYRDRTCPHSGSTVLAAAWLWYPTPLPSHIATISRRSQAEGGEPGESLEAQEARLVAAYHGALEDAAEGRVGAALSCLQALLREPLLQQSESEWRRLRCIDACISPCAVLLRFGVLKTPRMKGTAC